MPLLEDAKRTIERVTGWGWPHAREDLPQLKQSRKAHLLRFKDDGETPNDPRLPMILYRSPVKLRQQFDPAAIFEELFAANGWKDAGRNGSCFSGPWPLRLRRTLRDRPVTFSTIGR